MDVMLLLNDNRQQMGKWYDGSCRGCSVLARQLALARKKVEKGKCLVVGGHQKKKPLTTSSQFLSASSRKNRLVRQVSTSAVAGACRTRA